jgi:hypothetical protein
VSEYVMAAADPRQVKAEGLHQADHV